MKKTLEALQEDHSRLCAEAGDLGLSVPEDLTLDFDTAEVGATVVSNLEALIRKHKGEPSVNEAVADVPEGEHDAPRPKRARTTNNKKARSPAKAAGDGQPAGETTVAKAPKKVAVKKAAKKTKAKKTVVKKAAAKKAKTNGTGKKRAAKGDGPVAAVVAMLKSAKGCTRADILKKTGWKAVSVQQIAEGAGLKLKVSEERPFTYKAS